MSFMLAPSTVLPDTNITGVSNTTSPSSSTHKSTEWNLPGAADALLAGSAGASVVAAMGCFDISTLIND
jgi:hypothetical protein